MATEETITVKVEDGVTSTSTVRVISIEPIESKSGSREPAKGTSNSDRTEANVTNVVIKQEKDCSAKPSETQSLGSVRTLVMPNQPAVQYVLVTQPTVSQISQVGGVVASQPVVVRPKLILPHQATSSNGVLKLADGTVIVGLPANLPAGAMVTYPQIQQGPSPIASKVVGTTQQRRPQPIACSQLSSLVKQQIGDVKAAAKQAEKKNPSKSVRTLGAAKSKTGNGEVTRYPKIMPLPSDIPAVDMLNESSKEAYRNFRALVQQTREDVQMGLSSTFRTKSRSNSGSSSRDSMSSQPAASADNDDDANGDDVTDEYSTGAKRNSATENVTTSASPVKKRNRNTEPSPANKNDAYFERRRRNNFAAKRSRDARRQKEDEIAIRAAFLEQENVKLRIEVASLRAEVSRLHALFLAKGDGLVANTTSDDNDESV
jgi:bZIP factor